MKLAPLVLLLLAAAACSKPEPPKPEPAVDAAVAEDHTFKITATPPAATPSATETPAPTASATASAAAATPTGRPKAVATTTATASTPAAPEATPLKSASAHITGKNFVLDVFSPGCRADLPCAVTLHVAAVGDYHVNKEYPYKFIATPAAGVAFLSNGEPNVFSRASGDFHEDSEKAGTMTVRLKPSAAGNAQVAGTYKMSICSAEQCQIETQPVSLSIPVL